MIDQKVLDSLINKFQSNKVNIYRECAQHLLLSSFYRKENSEKILFKGGTALRVVYKSPRFSEDLDFSGTEINNKEIENILTDVLGDLDKENLKANLEEAKPTSGGYLSNITLSVYDLRVTIAIQISLRKKNIKGSQTLSIGNDYIPSYTANILPLSEIAGEKLQACLTRAKPRDFYDLYFLLRERLLPGTEMPELAIIEKKLDEKKINFQREIGLFLPLSMKPFIKSFPKPLIDEIKRFS